MITRLLVGIARSFFLVACVFLAIAGMAVYAAVRLLRVAFKREAPMPVRDATFGVLLALVALARAFQAMQPKTPPPAAPGPDEAIDFGPLGPPPSTQTEVSP